MGDANGSAGEVTEELLGRSLTEKGDKSTGRTRTSHFCVVGASFSFHRRPRLTEGPTAIGTPLPGRSTVVPKFLYSRGSFS